MNEELLKQIESSIAGAIVKHLSGVKDELGPMLDAKIKEEIKTLGLDKIDLKHGNFPFSPHGDAKSRKEKTVSFLRAVMKKDFEGIKSLYSDFDKKTMSEGIDSAGGFLVPEEVATDIDRVVSNFGLIRRLGRKIPMNRDIMNMPTLGTGPTVTWPGEGNAGSDGSPVFSSVKMNAKTAIGLSPMTNELLEDANVETIDVVVDLFAEALAGEEDNQAFTGTGSPFTGLLTSSDVNIVTAPTGHDTFAECDLDDYRDLISQIGETALPGSVWIMHKSVWGLVQKLKENSQHVSSFQNPLVSGKPEGGLLMPAGFLWGYPVYTSDKMPSTTAVSTKFAIFGNFKHFYFGDRKQMTMDISKEATVGSINSFASNYSILRVLERVSLNIGVPTAFSVLKTAAS